MLSDSLRVSSPINLFYFSKINIFILIFFVLAVTFEGITKRF